MEIPGLFPHFHVCESDCGATVLHSAKASTEMLGALRTSLCPYPKRQLHSQLRNGAGFERSPIKPRAQVRMNIPGEMGILALPQIPAPASLPARQLRYHTLGAE